MIELKGISKLFVSREVGSNYIINYILKKKRNGKIHALDNIRLKIKEGEFISIIGLNGSGKSTLLKILAGILQPTQGNLYTNGKIAPLLELGLGFHPELTAQENIRLYGILLGISRKEINEKIDKIIEFADLQSFKNAQLRVFSTGMQARLAFATAMQVNADIFLIDEVFSVGDLSFQQKCLRALEMLKQQGKTIILVSQDLHVVNTFSDRAVLLHQGRIVYAGKPHLAIQKYQKLVKQNTQFGHNDSLLQHLQREVHARDAHIAWLQGITSLRKRRIGNREVEIIRVLLSDGKGAGQYFFKTGEDMRIRIFYKIHKPVKNLIFGIIVVKKGIHCFGTNTRLANVSLRNIPREGFIDCYLKKIPFLEGRFVLSVNAHDENNYFFDWHDNYYSFMVNSVGKNRGLINMKCEWKLK